jgi:two-component system response regulator AtoC
LSPGWTGTRWVHPAPDGDQRAAVDGAGLKDGLEEVARQYERRRISECLLRNDGNKSKTARELRITRKTLAQKIAKYGLSL